MRDVTQKKANANDCPIVKNVGHMVVRANHLVSHGSDTKYRMIGPNTTTISSKFYGFDVPIYASPAPPGNRLYESEFICPACGDTIVLRIKQGTMLYLSPENLKQDRHTKLVRKVNSRRILYSLWWTVLYGWFPSLIAYVLPALVVERTAGEPYPTTPAALLASITFGIVLLCVFRKTFHPSRGVLLVIKHPTDLVTDHPSLFNYVKSVCISNQDNTHYLGDVTVLPQKTLIYNAKEVNQGWEIPSNTYRCWPDPL